MLPLMTVLDDARWAPSGDNTQCWRFEPRGERALVVHGFDTRAHCVYDLRGEASQLSLGALLETMAIAATRHGWAMQARRRLDPPDDRPTFDVDFVESGLPMDPLLDSIRRRAVQRRPLKTRPLTDVERTTLERSVAPGYRVRWFASTAERWRCARLMFSNAHLRLTLPEAYPTHRDVIEWGARESIDRVPDQALGADPVALLMMRFVLKSWGRVQFFNRFLAGTWLPRLQMDLLPSLACAAHVALVADHVSTGIDDQVAAGRAVQRFWLTATQLGLWQQPEMTPLIFARYARQGQVYTAVARLQQRAQLLASRLEALLGAQDAERAVWMGRIGEGNAPKARSVRRPLQELIVSDVGALAGHLSPKNR